MAEDATPGSRRRTLGSSRRRRTMLGNRRCIF
jgi:hypothetical protein